MSTSDDYLTFVLSRFNDAANWGTSLTGMDVNIVHCGVAIGEEAIEVWEAAENRHKLAEEIGDLLYYVHALGYFLGITFPTDPRLTESSSRCKLNELLVLSGKCAGLVKKAFIHKRPNRRDELVRELHNLFVVVLECAQAFGIDIPDIYRLNQEKITKRFPSGHPFSSVVYDVS